MWGDLQHENWIDRGQKTKKQTASEDQEQYERLKREAGVK